VSVAGYYLAGHNLGETVGARQLVVQSVLTDLPNGKLRCVSGTAGPQDIVRCVAAGFDILESRFVPKGVGVR
jgi:queuine/archaeosine tRNA-ribosyltransferase